MGRGGFKRAAPTRSVHSLRPSAKEPRGTPASPTLFWICEGAGGASERQQHKWDEHGARLLRASRERSRHEGDSRLCAGWPLCPQFGCARFVALEPRNERSRGGRSTAGSRHERAAALGILGESAGHARANGQDAPHRAGRGEAQAKAFLSWGFDDCLSPTEPLTDETSHSDFGLDQIERLRHYSLEVSRATEEEATS